MDVKSMDMESQATVSLLLWVLGRGLQPSEEQYALFSTGLSLQSLLPILGVSRITSAQDFIAGRLYNECLPTMHEATPLPDF